MNEQLEDMRRAEVARMIESCISYNPLMARIHRTIERRETEKWLSGSPEVSVGVYAEYPYPGWAR